MLQVFTTHNSPSGTVKNSKGAMDSRKQECQLAKGIHWYINVISAQQKRSSGQLTVAVVYSKHNHCLSGFTTTPIVLPFIAPHS